MRIVILGLSITSSWGNGHATTYRALVRALVGRGHDVLFLERDVPWYRNCRDLSEPPYGRTVLYDSLGELRDRFAEEVRSADLVMVGSYVPEGIDVGEWVLSTAHGVTAFYDIDTPVTLATLGTPPNFYISRALMPRYDLYLSFTGGPVLEEIEQRYGARLVRPLYCSVDPDAHRPVACEQTWDAGYLGTFSDDRQPLLERLMLDAARRWPDGRFAVAGSLYPSDVSWPANVERFDHLAPEAHARFYCSQRFTINITRAAMKAAGYSPSVRLFEAAACGTPIITDDWPGLEAFFTPGENILVARTAGDTLACLKDFSETERTALAARARTHVVASHSADERARSLEGYVRECRGEAALVP
jgi:spore maturation protein CgeB